MFRSLHVIVAALKIIGVSEGTAKSWAPEIQRQAKKHRFDPITMVVMIEGESHGNPNLVNSIGCVGLLQVCPQFLYPYCKKGKSFNKAKCDAKKAQLKNPIVSIRMTANSITANRKFCKKLTGSPNLWRHWMPSHGGYNKGNHKKKTGVWCGQKYVCKKRKGKRCLKRGWVNVPIPKTIQRYMKRRRQIIKRLSRRRKKK